jgi:hypothetical protein
MEGRAHLVNGHLLLKAQLQECAAREIDPVIEGTASRKRAPDNQKKNKHDENGRRQSEDFHPADEIEINPWSYNLHTYSRSTPQ